MRRSRARVIGQALGRLRVAVNGCCWIIGLSLVAQLVVWSLLSYTELRWETVEAVDLNAPLIVNTDAAKKAESRTIPQAPVIVNAPATTATPPSAVPGIPAVTATNSPAPAPVSASAAVAGPMAPTAPAAPAVAQTSTPTPQAPQRVLSRHDGLFRAITMFAGGVGTLATVALLPLLAVGVMLCAGSATPGVDKTVSAFCWSVLLALLILPVGGSLGLALSGGAYSNYSEISLAADAARNQSTDHVAMVYYGRYLVLPIMCVIGVTLVGLRFGSGVELGLVPWDDVDYDPTVEGEASGVKPSSLMGGRAGGALGRMLTPPSVSSTGDKLPPANKVAAGEVPKRLI